MWISTLLILGCSRGLVLNSEPAFAKTKVDKFDTLNFFTVMMIFLVRCIIAKAMISWEPPLVGAVFCFQTTGEDRFVI